MTKGGGGVKNPENLMTSFMNAAKSKRVIQRTPIKPNSLTYLKNFYPKFFPKNCKMLDPGTIKIRPKIWRENKVTKYI